MNIVLAASEAYPFCKTGGLADVIGSLPVSLAKRDNYDVRVILPLYGKINEYGKTEPPLRVEAPSRACPCAVAKQGTMSVEALPPQ